MYRIEEHETEDLLVEEPSADYGYTYADYIKWRIEERIELFRGRIHKLSTPNTIHQSISGNLLVTIHNFLKKQSCRVFSAPFDVRLPVQNKKKDNEITTVVQPDIMVVCDPGKLDERGVCGAPDIVIEILSPGISKAELKYKFELYEEAGVQEYWIINPTHVYITIYTLQEGRYVGSKPYNSGQFITTPVLPGLRIDVQQIFEN